MNQIKFTADTITFEEIRNLAKIVNNFFKDSQIIEKTQTENFKPFSDIPKLILEDEKTMTAFIKIVEFCTGIDIDDKKGIQTMKLIQETLDFINEVNVTGFLFKTTMTFLNMTKE
jgi:hypothetical protein